MSRVQHDLPEKSIFTTEIAVRATDLNYGGHVGNDTILSFMQEARVQFYRALGFKNEVSLENSVGQIITDAAIQYKSESFLGDVLTIRIAVADFNKYGFDMFYIIENKATGKSVAIGKTGIVCFDYDKRKIATIPNILLDKLKALTEHKSDK
jgi:YbgC/YbaW family acyl-CoA thioester hydrolase